MLIESGYDRNKTRFLVDGFWKGFRIDCTTSPPSRLSGNLQSAKHHPETVSQKLIKEIKAHRIAGPFANPPFPNFVCSPLGVCPKKKPGTFRLIHHLSFPEGQSVNDGISEYMYASSVQYTTLSHAISQIKKLGCCSFLAKSDIESAFHLLPIHPDDHHLLGMSWDNKYYYDLCLPMGCSSSCKLFEKFSSALEHIVRHQTNGTILHFLDDFLLVGQTESECKHLLETFINTADSLRVPLAVEKTEGPTTVLSFLGIELDTKNQIARLPPEKIRKMQKHDSLILPRKKTNLHTTQSLLGLLNFTCNVVPGWPFLRRLIDRTCGIRKLYFKVTLNKETKRDLQVWLDFLNKYNGQTFFCEERIHTSVSLHLYTDAAQELGFGAIFGKKWLHGSWPKLWKEYNFVILELYPIVLALETSGEEFRNKAIRFHSDNLALVHIINKQTSKDPQTMVLVRRMGLSLSHLQYSFSCGTHSW